MRFGRLMRREFIALIGSSPAWPLVARAQQADLIRRVGILHPGVAEPTKSENDALRLALQQLGWTDGVNIRLDSLVLGEREDLQAGADRLLGLRPDVMVTVGPPAAETVRRRRRSRSCLPWYPTRSAGCGMIQPGRRCSSRSKTRTGSTRRSRSFSSSLADDGRRASEGDRKVRWRGLGITRCITPPTIA